MRTLTLCLLGSIALSACRAKDNTEKTQDVDTDTDTDIDTDTDETGDTGETGDPEEAIIAEVVGEDGGTLEGEEGEHSVSLDIPAGSLEADVEIVVETVEIEDLSATIDEFADLSGTAWVFTPHGTTFANEVAFTFSQDGTADAVLRLDDETDTSWEMVSNVNFSQNTLSFMNNTFSIYVPVAICQNYCQSVMDLCSGLVYETCLDTCESNYMVHASSCSTEVWQNNLCISAAERTADDFDCATGAPIPTTCQAEQVELQDCASGGSCSDLSGSWRSQISLNGQTITTQDENGSTVDLTLVGVVEPEAYSSVSSYVQGQLPQSEYPNIFRVNFGLLDINGQPLPEEPGEMETMFMGEDSQGNFKLVNGEEEFSSASSSHICNSDEQSLDFTLQLDNTVVISFRRSWDEVDSDGDGTSAWNDCDDSDPSSTRISQDGDCDGVLTEADCDDQDSSSTTVAIDGDCDTILTADDCDDSDAGSTIVAEDADCDGTITEEDCDDSDASSTIHATDQDCDGTLTADDCDDSDPGSTIVATDGDCDGTVTSIDCDDSDPNSMTVLEDIDCNGVSNARMIEAGASHSCALDSTGSATCWGENNYGQSTPPSTSFEKLVAGSGLTCGLDSAGAMECWGNDTYSQISSAPSGNFIDLHLGAYAACALDTSGSIQCWGNDYYSEISNAPTSGTFTALFGGPYNTCAIDTSGSIQCWGDSSYNKLSSIPAGSFTDVSVGMFTICGLDTSGAIQCWGGDIYNQITNVPSGTFTKLVGGALHHCALNSAGAISCWGDDTDNKVSGALSIGTFIAISAGNNHSCAVPDTGNVYCWGNNTYAQSAVPSGLNVLY